jgi:hypothetical protein
MAFKRILTPLDVHLDTRAATVARINPEAASRLLETTDYWTRENDFWEQLTGGLITREEFNEAYAQRGGENTNATLERSVRTNITPFILRLLTDDLKIRANLITAADEPEIALTINYWPYDLTPDGIESFRSIMHYFYGNEMEIEMVSIPMTELTPTYLNENFAAIITYDFPEWIKYHAVELGKATMNCFNFISPKIFEADVSRMTPDAKKQILNEFHFKYLIHMDFEWIDASYFSVINVHGKDRPDFPTAEPEDEGHVIAGEL